MSLNRKQTKPNLEMTVKLSEASPKYDHPSQTWQPKPDKHAKEKQDLEGNYEVLSKNYINSKDKLVQLLTIQDQLSWKVVLIFSIVTTYLIDTYNYTLSDNYATFNFIVVPYVGEVIFCIDFLLALIVRRWPFLQIFMRNRPRGMHALIFDGCSLIPLAMFYNLYTGSFVSKPYPLCLRSISFLRLYRVNVFFVQFAKSAGVTHWRHFITQYFLYFFLLAHTLACTWFLFADELQCPFTDEPGKSWIYSLCRAQFNVAQFPQYTKSDWYLLCMYFAMSTITNAGYGDIYPYLTAERVVVGLAMCMGFGLTAGFFIGTLSSLFVNSTRRRAEYSYQLRRIVNNLKNIGMADAETREVIEYYNGLWHKKSGIKMASEIDLLPTPLKMEIYFDVNYILLKKSLLFRKQSEAVLRNVSLCMRHEFYLPGDVIFRDTAPKYMMICVASGVIEVLSDENNRTPVMSFGVGTCIGESALVMTKPAQYFMRASTYTELQVLYRHDFLYIISIYPSLYARFRRSIQDRIDASRTKIVSHEPEEMNMYFFITPAPKSSTMSLLRVKMKNPQKQFDEEFYTDCLGLYNLVDNVRVRKGKYLFLSPEFPWIKQANTSLVRAWNFFVFCVVLFVCITYPYYISFEYGFPGWMDTAKYFVHSIYFLDIFVTLTTVVEEKNNMIDTVEKIFNKKIFSIGFHLDVYSTFFIEIFSQGVSEDRDHIYYVLMLNRLLKGWHIFWYFFLLEQDWSSNLMLIRLIKYPLYLLLISFWIGVTLYMEACFTLPCRASSWFSYKAFEEVFTNNSKPITTHPTFMAIYYAMTISSGVAYGDILASDKRDIYFQCICAFIGLLTFAFCIAEFSATFTHYASAKTQFQENLYAIQNFLMDHRITPDLQQRVIDYCGLQWRYNRGIYIKKQHSLFYNASLKIQEEVIVKERQDMIRMIPIFANMEVDLLKLITARSKVMILPPGEAVVREGGMTRELYIVQKGYCQRQKGGRLSHYLGPNEWFGLTELLFDSPCLSSVHTVTHCKLLCVDRTAFEEAVSIFPNFSAQISDLLKDRELMETVDGMTGEIRTEKWKPRAAKPLPFTEKVKKMISGSFVLVRNVCRENGEDYNAPFSRSPYWYIFKHFFLPVCILPNGKFIQYWMFFRMLISFVYAIFIPYHITLAPYGTDYHILFRVFDYICLFDLYLLLHVGYFGSNNQSIIHPHRTSKNYVRGMFWIDFLSCFPFEWLTNFTTPTDTTVPRHERTNYSALKINRVIQIYYRWPLFFRYMDTGVFNQPDSVQILKFVPLTLVTINIWACALVSTGCQLFKREDINPRYKMSNGQMAAPPGYPQRALRNYTMFCKTDSWLDQSLFLNNTAPDDVFMVAFYWATSTIVSAGFGDITPHEDIHIIMCICMMVFGVLYFGYVYASIASSKAEMNTTQSYYRGMMTELLSFMRLENVDPHLQICVTNHLEYRWIRSGGCEPHVILAKINTCLLEDVVANMYEETLRKVPLFEQMDHSFFRIIGKQLRERYFIRGEVVARCNDVLENICIVYRGKVDVISEVNEMEVCMGTGGLFGNVTGAEHALLSKTILASRNSDILYMPSAEFYTILKLYPKAYEKIVAVLKSSNDFIMPTVEIETGTDIPSNVFSGNRVSIGTENVRSRTTRGSMGTYGRTEPTIHFLFKLFRPHNWFRFGIIPEATIFTILDYLSLFAAYVNVVFVVYQFSFQDKATYLYGLAVTLDIIFFFKIFLELHKGFRDMYGEVVLDPKKIRHRYMSHKRRRLYDVIGNVPISYFVVIFSQPQRAFTVVRLLTLFRLQYIFDFYHIRSKLLMVNKFYLKLSTIVIWITLISHLFACIWFSIACPFFYCESNSWVLIDRLDTSEDSLLYWYVTSFYYVLNILTTTGLGEIYPVNFIEHLVTITFMITTKFMIGIFIGDVTSVLNSYISPLVNYEYGIIELRDYLRNMNVSEHQLNKMWDYVCGLWTRGRGKQHPRLLLILPMGIQCDLMLSLYGQHLRDSYIFSEIGEDFLRQITRLLKHYVFFPGNYIVQHGDIDQCMYFIHRGQVDVLTVHANLTETIHDILGSVDMFGVAQGLNRGVPHHFSFRARSTVDIVSLCLHDWQHLLQFFPGVEKRLYERAEHLYVHV